MVNSKFCLVLAYLKIEIYFSSSLKSAWWLAARQVTTQDDLFFNMHDVRLFANQVF